MQVFLIGLALLLAFVPVAFIKRLSVGDSRAIRIVRRGLFTVAVVCGGAAMGLWVLTQSDAGITPQEGPRTLAIMFGSSIAFVAALTGSAFLAHQKKGFRIVLRCSLFLIGVGGLSVLVFFVLTSRGLIFGFGPLPLTVLLISLICVALFWRADHVARTHPR